MNNRIFSFTLTCALSLGLVLLVSCYGGTVNFNYNASEETEESKDSNSDYTTVSVQDSDQDVNTVVASNLDFDQVSNHIPAKVYVTQKSPANVRFEGNQSDIQKIETRVKNGELQIRFKDEYKNNNWRNFNVTVYVDAPVINGLSVHGSGDIEGKNRLKVDDFEASVHGSGNIKAEIEGEDVDLNIHGSGNIELTGQAKEMDAKIHGSGNIECLDLSATNCEASIHGSGNCYVNVTEAIEASIFGSGDIKYKGNPPRIQTKSHGSGSVRSVN